MIGDHERRTIARFSGDRGVAQISLQFGNSRWYVLLPVSVKVPWFGWQKFVFGTVQGQIQDLQALGWLDVERTQKCCDPRFLVIFHLNSTLALAIGKWFKFFEHITVRLSFNAVGRICQTLRFSLAQPSQKGKWLKLSWLLYVLLLLAACQRVGAQIEAFGTPADK